MADFTTEDLAYAAGIIDGEGCIGLTEYSVNPAQRRKSPQFRCYVAVAMTDFQVPLWLASTFGGTAHAYEGRKEGHKGVTQWRLQNRKAAEFCALILPYLRVKVEQGKLLIQFYADERFDFTRRGTGSGLPAEEILQRREYVSKIQLLNRRGAVTLQGGGPA